MENRSDRTLNYGRFGCWKTETEPFDSFPQTPGDSPLLSIVAEWLDGSRIQDATWYGGRPRPRPLCVRWRPSSSTERGTAPPPTFQPMSTVAKWSPISATDELVVYPMHWIDPVISFVRFLTFQQLQSKSCVNRNRLHLRTWQS